MKTNFLLYGRGCQVFYIPLLHSYRLRLRFTSVLSTPHATPPHHSVKGQVFHDVMRAKEEELCSGQSWDESHIHANKVPHHHRACPHQGGDGWGFNVVRRLNIKIMASE